MGAKVKERVAKILEWPNVSAIIFAAFALFNVSLRGIIATRYFCVGVWGSLVGNLHHVKIHQSGVLVLILLRQVQEAILFVEGIGGEVGIDGDEAEGGI